MLNVNNTDHFEESFKWLSKIKNKELIMDLKWLGEGNTSELIVNKLKLFLS